MASWAGRADPRGSISTVAARRRTCGRRFGIWPEAVAPPVRRFLVGNLKGGMVSKAIDMKVAMTGADIDKAVSGGPIPAMAVADRLSRRAGRVQGGRGIAGRSRADVNGSGIRRRRAARGAESRGADGRRYLDASRGAFILENYWRKDAAAASISASRVARMAWGHFCSPPLVHEIAGFELDPATMKGQADLRSHQAAGEQYPELRGSSHFGRGHLERPRHRQDVRQGPARGRESGVGYDRGTLAIKGDGKLGGSPAIIDLHARDAGGDADVTFTLDDAARARRRACLRRRS